MALLSLSGLDVRYGAIQAVRGLDLEVAEGEIVALLGANGAGKSTTLKAIVGLVRSKGEIRFADASIAGRDTEEIVRSGLTMVPEGRRVFPTLTVAENLRLGAATRRDPAGAPSRRREGAAP